MATNTKKMSDKLKMVKNISLLSCKDISELCLRVSSKNNFN